MSAPVCFSMAALLVACSTGSGVAHQSSGQPAAKPTLAVDIPTAATPIGGCGQNPVYRGPVPTWLEVADSHNTPSGLPWVVATPPLAAAFLWRSPLRVGHPGNLSDKILWVVRTPRVGSDLEIPARPLSGSVFLARTPAQPSELAAVQLVPVLGSERVRRWTSDPASAQTVIPRAQPFAVTVDNHSFVGQGLALIEETSIGGDFRVWHASAPTGPWSE